jgi:hypothetical protein
VIEVGDRVWKNGARALPQRPSTFESVGLCALLAGAGVLFFVVAESTDIGTATAALVCPAAFVSIALIPVLVNLRGHRAWTRARAAAPREPWAWDHPWASGPIELEDPGGQDARPRVGPVTKKVAAVGAACVLLFIALEVWSWSGPLGRSLVVATGLGVAAFVAHAFMRLRDVRAARLRCSAFPIRLGQPFELLFGMDEQSGHFDELRFILRCLGEGKPEWNGTPCRVEFQAVVEIGADRIPEPGADIAVPVEFPAHAPGTDFAQRYARYWELVVEGAGAFGGFQRTFLLPVYA